MSVSLGAANLGSVSAVFDTFGAPPSFPEPVFSPTVKAIS